MSKFLLNVLLIALIVVIFLLSVIICAFITEELILPSDWLFYEEAPVFNMLLAPLLILPSIAVSCYLINKIAKCKVTFDDHIDSISSMKIPVKVKIVLVAVWLFAVYICMTTLTYVTETEIVVLKPYDIYGRHYSYSEVEKIEAGFGTKKIAIMEHHKRGNFYYKLMLDDNTVVFSVPSVNDDVEKYQDSYIELEELDAALEGLNIPKASSREGYEYCDYEQCYIDRFLRIIG